MLISAAVPSKMTTALPAQPNQSVIAALHCMEAVLANGTPIGVRELSRQLDMDRARVNRLLKTLAAHGVLGRTDRGRYCGGPGILALAALARESSGLDRAVMKHAKPWWAQGFAVTVGVLWREYICYILRARPELPFEEALGARHAPALNSSAGLMLVAHLPEIERNKLQLHLAPEADANSPDIPALVAQTQQRGYARIQFEEGIVSLGAGIQAPPVAAIAVSSKIKPAEEPGIVRRLQTTANAIAADLDLV